MYNHSSKVIFKNQMTVVRVVRVVSKVRKTQHQNPEHSILRFNQMSLYFADTTERGDRRVKGGPKTR
jgi:hypothetical protein